MVTLQFSYPVKIDGKEIYAKISKIRTGIVSVAFYFGGEKLGEATVSGMSLRELLRSVKGELENIFIDIVQKKG